MSNCQLGTETPLSLASSASLSEVSLSQLLTTRLIILETNKERMMDYLDMKREDQDWHGVQDAASDIRDLESQINELQFALSRLEKSADQPLSGCNNCNCS